MDAESIISRLKNLAAKDKDRQVFGSQAHNYELNPPLDVSVIEDFEQKHGISLPADYRQFITEIGNGGAGPEYGLFPFGKSDEGVGLKPWEEGILMGDVGKPFPYKKAWNLPKKFWKQEPDPPEDISEEEEARIWKEWDRKLEKEYWCGEIMNGAIQLCDCGCNLRQWLVVNGDQRGYIWDDLRADEDGLKPVKDRKGKQRTFYDWYLSWLHGAERTPLSS